MTDSRALCGLGNHILSEVVHVSHQGSCLCGTAGSSSALSMNCACSAFTELSEAYGHSWEPGVATSRDVHHFVNELRLRRQDCLPNCLEHGSLPVCHHWNVNRSLVHNRSARHTVCGLLHCWHNLDLPLRHHRDVDDLVNELQLRNLHVFGHCLDHGLLSSHKDWHVNNRVHWSVADVNLNLKKLNRLCTTRTAGTSSSVLTRTSTACRRAASATTPLSS